MKYFNKKPFIAVFVALLAGLSLSALTVVSNARGPAMFANFDADADGYISKEELYSGRAKRIAYMAERGGQMRGVASAPGFEQLDVDGDQQISKDEFDKGHQQHMMGRQGWNSQSAGMRGSGGQGKGMNAPDFSDMDANSNGQVDVAEFDSFHQLRMANGQFRSGMGGAGNYRFEDLDLDHNGVINVEEFDKHRASAWPRR